MVSGVSAIERFHAVATWNSLMRQAVNNGDSCNTFLLFRQMKAQSLVQPNNVSFLFVAKACAKMSDYVLSRILHSHLVKTPYCFDMYVQTSMVDVYVKCNSLDCAHKVFDEMPSKDVASWNAILLGYAQLGSVDSVTLLFNRMRLESVVPDAVSIIGLTQLATGMKDTQLLSIVQCFSMKCGYEVDASVVNTYISSYAKCGDLCSAERVFYGTGLNILNVISWNAIIAGLASSENAMKAVEFYKQMLHDEYRPDLSTILNLVSSFAHPDYISLGKLVHAHGVKFGCDTDITFLNTLISMYSKCGHTFSAQYIFDHMNERSCVTWTIMIGVYSEIGDLNEALSLFHNMIACGAVPDLVTVIHLIGACGKVSSLDIGKRLDDYAVSKGLKNNLMVCNALMDMYSKCGSIGDAQEVFSTMVVKNVVSWTTLISGLALNGKFWDSIDHFDKMLKLDLKPNHVTISVVLQACTHGGLLNKGIEVFDMMTKIHKLKPDLDHYSCMSHLLARQGKLKEALEFIQDMPMKPDAGIWGCLLSACRIHRNVEVAEYASDQLFKLEPQAAAPYVEMANTYASANDWNGVAAIRMKMKNSEVNKFPGCSFIEIDGKCKSFAVEDRLNSKGCEIFVVLDGLVSQLKEEDDYLEL